LKDQIPRIVSGANWITPVVTLVQDIVNGPTSHFAVPGAMAGGPDRREIRRALQDNGVSVWGLMYSPDLELLMFSVHERQAKRTFHILSRAGIPILNAPPRATRSAGEQPSTWSSRHKSKKRDTQTLLEHLFDFLDLLDRRT
jgi:hypothetical protein